MGRTSKWLRILLGVKKDPKQCPVPAETACHGSEVPRMTSKDKQKRRWSVQRSSKDRRHSCEDMSWAAPPTAHRYADNSNSVFDSQQQDKSKHAGPVAAVRLADNNDCIISCYGVTKISAAIRIQALFRGYLARRALRALKALVKLQALVRGFLVRKQAHATLYCMRSLIRVQARARANRLSFCNSDRLRASSIQQKQQQQHQSHEHRPCKAMLQKGSNLHKETVAAYTQSRRSFTFQQQDLPEDTAKVVEVDSVKHRRQSVGRRNISSAQSPGPHYLSHPSLYSPGPASDELTANLVQDQLNSPMKPGRGFHGLTRDTDCRYHIEDCRTSSVQTSPRFCTRKNTAAAMSSNGVLTPSRSDYSQGFAHYMANTESSRAKVRSQSAPKQRHQAAEKSVSFGGRKRVPLQETTVQVQSRQSFSGFGAAKEEYKSHQNHRKLHLLRSLPDSEIFAV